MSSERWTAPDWRSSADGLRGCWSCLPACSRPWVAPARRLVPDRLFVLKNKRLEVTLHPSDIAISGKREDVARARAAIATRVTFTAAYMTSAKESQQVEDVLLAISEGRAPARRHGRRG